MDSFLEFKDAEATLATIAEQLAEEKIPVQHVTDGVAKVLGTKGAVRFLTHLKPGAEKHTTWDKTNSALVKQGVKTHHIAKIATHIKPAQYKEDVDLDEAKDIVIRDKSGNVTSWSHEGDWSKSKSAGTTTDKSGAKHTPYSKARNLARTALKKTLTKEETDVCAACGQTPCNCTHITEATIHRIGVTVSDPNHTMVSQRKEKVQKFVRVTHDNESEAVARGKKHFAKKGWKVHDAWHAGKINEETEELDELSNQLLQRYKDKAMKSADDLAAKGQHTKANDRYMKHMQASGKQISTTMKKIHARMNKEEIELEEATKDELRAALARHEQNAIDANRRGDHDAVKMHQERMNKVKDKMAKLARSE